MIEISGYRISGLGSDVLEQMYQKLTRPNLRDLISRYGINHGLDVLVENRNLPLDMIRVTAVRELEKQFKESEDPVLEVYRIIAGIRPDLAKEFPLNQTYQ